MYVGVGPPPLARQVGQPQPKPPSRHGDQGGGGGQQKKKEPETGRNACSKTAGHKAALHTAGRRAPTGHTTIHKGTMRCEHCSNHQMQRTPSEPSANTPPPSTRCPRTPQGRTCAPRSGRCPPRGWQQGHEQPTGHGAVHVHVVWRCEILVWGGRRVGQEGVHDMGTQQRHQTGGGATQTHRTREPHQEGQGRAQQTRRGTARQERQPEQREQETRMERMGERAHGRQRQ